MAGILRGFELRLIRCTLSPLLPAASRPHAQPPLSDSHAHVNQLISFIEAGDYLLALSSDSARLFYGDLSCHIESPDRFYSELVETRLERFVGSGGDDEDKACRVILIFTVAVAAFLCFTQRNITGPLDEFPGCPLPLGLQEGRKLEDWEAWARRQLMSNGSLLAGKLYNLQYIVYAKMLVTRTKDLLFEGSIVSSDYGFRSISWWLSRILLVEQRILDEPSSVLFDLLQVYSVETLRHFGTLEQVISYWGSTLHEGEGVDIVSMAHLEAGVMQYTYGRVDLCRQHIKSAEAAANLELSVTGVLGFRTVHQTEPRALRVLVTKGNSPPNDDKTLTLKPGIFHDSNIVEDKSLNHLMPNLEASEIYMTPKLENGGEDATTGINNQDPNLGATSLKAAQQALVLAQCLLIEKSSREDELRKWDVAPFIEAIDSQRSSPFILRCFCDLLRVRWESTRSRTKERALEMMSHLVEVLEKELPKVAQRVPFCYVAFFPTVPSLQKEYGEFLISCGLIGEALRIFEDLELWNNVIYCNSLLGKKAAAVELIKARLSEMPNDPSLWCSLGDLTNDDSCYRKALEVSDDKSARAKRCLARSAFDRGDYETSKTLWESAMILNSLYPDGWFALGAAALKARDVDKAVDAFTRAVQLDPDNGEAWNNIACLHMIRNKSKEACISFKEALKFKRDSWQMWENYSHVAMDVGDTRQALEAVQMVLQMTKLKRIDSVLLERIMADIEGRCLRDLASTNDEHVFSKTSVDSDSLEESDVGRPRQSKQLLELLGRLLQQIVKTGGGTDSWGLYARWHKIKGDLTLCSEALLKQVRSYQGSDLWKDRDRFRKFAGASLELCKVYMQISTQADSRRELFSAELHLKNTIKQAECFSDMEEFKNLNACLHEVQMNFNDESQEK